MSDLRQSDEYAEYMSKLGWLVEKHDNASYFVKQLPFFSVIKILRPKIFDPDPSLISPKKFRYTNIIVHPYNTDQENSLIKNNFKKIKKPYYTKTLQLDLTVTATDIYSKFTKNTQYALRKTKDLKIYRVDRIGKFLLSWKEAVRFPQYTPSLKDLYYLSTAFGQNSLFLVTPDGSSGAIFLKAGDSVYYWQAFTNPKGRKSSAQYKIVWSAITWAKQSGAKVFDFEGIYDERFPRKEMLGFTHFKKSFGGSEVYYPGSYTKLTLPYIIKLHV